MGSEKFDIESNNASPLAQGVSLSRPMQRISSRGNPTGLINGPAVVNPNPEILLKYRTLSIQVTDTKEGHADPKTSKGVADLSALEWHTLSKEEVLTRFGVSPQTGLDGPMVSRRLAQHGKNVITPPPRNWARKIFFYIFGGFGSLLFVASILCFIAWKPLGDPNPQVANVALAGVLLVVMAIQAFFNAWQDYSTGRVMASIASMLPTNTIVTRDGKTFQLPASQLVAGDIVKITLGAKVPADVRLLEVSSDLKFDRSILTGESDAISGTVNPTDQNFVESHNIALQGTLCTSGSGQGVCVGLGDSTVFGRIAKQAIRERPARTTLETEILLVVLIIAFSAFFVVILIVVVWAAWLRRDHPSFINVPTLLTDLVALAVAFLPDGLPVCVILSLTVVAGAMRKSNILCKSLSTVEGLGAVNVICSDKTGTLTRNRMSVANVAIGNSCYTVLEARKVTTTADKASDSIRALAAVAGLCNDSLFENENHEQPPEIRKVNGDATDAGLLRFSESIESVEATRGLWREAGKITFNSKNKFAIKLFRCESGMTSAPFPILPSDNFQQEDYVLLVKGAPDILIRRCSQLLHSTGDISPLRDENVASITAIQEKFALRGQRVLLLAKKIIPAAELEKGAIKGSNWLEEQLLAVNIDLTIVGLVAMLDPPRDDTADTVRVCRGAGIRFLMVTGDFALTATAIAEQVGIITNPLHSVKHLVDLPYDKPLDEIPAFDSNKEKGDLLTSLVLTGGEMKTMTESQWKQVLTFDEIVFARTSPQQKFQIVQAFQASGCTVAVTGDGVNDAPALKQADVGVAMADGSEVAMEAADLILLDKFSAIITSIEYGRLCFENLRKTILYLLPAGSFSELIPMLLNVFFGLPQVLSSFQMIVICTITDVIPALSLVYEKPEADLLQRKPRDRKTEHLITWKLVFHAYFFIGLLESLTALTSAFYFGFQRNGVPFSALWLSYGGPVPVSADRFTELTNKAQSIYFFNLVLMQWFNLLATRTRRLSLLQQNPIAGPNTRNILIFPAMLVSLGLGCFFSYIPWFQQIFGTQGVEVEFFFLPLAYGFAVLLLDEARKWYNRKHPRSWLARIAW